MPKRPAAVTRPWGRRNVGQGRSSVDVSQRPKSRRMCPEPKERCRWAKSSACTRRNREASRHCAGRSPSARLTRALKPEWRASRELAAVTGWPLTKTEYGLSVASPERQALSLVLGVETRRMQSGIDECFRLRPNVWHQRRAKRVRCMPGLGQGGLKRRRKLRRGLAGGTF